MGTHTLATLPRTTSALAADLVLIHKAAENETYACTASDFRTIIKEGLDLGLADIQGLGDLAALDNIDTSYVNSLGMLAALDEVGMYNNISNPYLSYWSAGTSLANPTGWTTVGSARVYKETTICPEWASCSARVNANAQPGALRARLTLYEYNYGNPLSFSAWVYATAAAKVCLSINITDGVNTTSLVSSYHPGDSTWQLLTVDGLTVPVSSTLSYGQMDVASGATGYMTFAAFVWGARAPRYLHPRGWYNPSGESGFVNNGSFLGFFRNDGWRVYLDSSGNFICRTNSGDYAFRYYGTASGAYGEGDVFIGSTLAGEGSIWWDQSAKNFQLDGDFRVISGGDIRLIGAASNPGKITWDGTSYEVEAFMDAPGDNFYIRPCSAGTGADAYIGTTTLPFDIAQITALDCYVYAYHNSANYGRLWCSANSGFALVRLSAKELNTLKSLSFSYEATNSSWSFAPNAGSTSQGLSGGVDLGTNAYYFKTVECVTLDDSHDVSWLDEHDDLGDMMKIAPLVDAKGEPVRDAKTGNQIIDDSTLPEYLCTKVDGQVHWRGDRTHGPNAAFHGWLLGGIRQLYSMVNSSFAQVNSSYAALDTRIRDLETRRI